MEHLNNADGGATANDNSVDAGANKIDPNTLVVPDIGKINIVHILVIILLALAIIYLFKKTFLTQTISYVSN